MIDKWKEGYDIVYGVREERYGETWFKRTTAAAFYRLLRKLTDLNLPVDVGDFRLVDRKALESFRALREKNRYVRGLFSWIGFKQTGVRYKRAARYAGDTKYPLSKMLKLATDGVLSFSMFPLRLALNAGFWIAGLAFLGGIWAIIEKAVGVRVVPGWVSLLVAVAFLGGIQLIILGIMGEYIGRIYEEVKNRPLYIVRSSSAEKRELMSGREQ
jgi:dolichol-phosphate mannosyltransferase